MYGLRLVEFAHSSKKCIFSIDDGPFFCNCRVGVSLQLVGHPVAPGWALSKEEWPFMLPPRPLGREG